MYPLRQYSPKFPWLILKLTDIFCLFACLIFFVSDKEILTEIGRHGRSYNDVIVKLIPKQEPYIPYGLLYYVPALATRHFVHSIVNKVVFQTENSICITAMFIFYVWGGLYDTSGYQSICISLLLYPYTDLWPVTYENWLL